MKDNLREQNSSVNNDRVGGRPVHRDEMLLTVAKNKLQLITLNQTRTLRPLPL